MAYDEAASEWSEEIFISLNSDIEKQTEEKAELLEVCVCLGVHAHTCACVYLNMFVQERVSIMGETMQKKKKRGNDWCGELKLL